MSTLGSSVLGASWSRGELAILILVVLSITTVILAIADIIGAAAAAL